MAKHQWIFACASVAVLGTALQGCASDDAQESPEATTPNPLAMPCGALNSGFEGDERCILPPESGTGIQLHVGPKSYADQTELAKYRLEPGKEITECYYFNNPSTDSISFFQQVYRMRPGSHHLIVRAALFGAQPGAVVPEEGWGDCYIDIPGVDYMPIGGTQSGISEFPPGGEMAPEDENLYRPLPPGIPMIFEMHFVNATPQPILREAWVNLENKVVENGQVLGGVFMGSGRGIEIPLGETRRFNYWCDNQVEQRRVVSLFGHRHAHTKRYSAWVTRGGQRELVYEDYDWHETAELIYNSVIENPRPVRDTLQPGGYSGGLILDVGDRLEFECEVDNTEAMNQALQKEYPDFQPDTLRWGNEVYTGEMCMLFGSMVNDAGELFWRNRPPADPTVPNPCSPRL